MIVPKERASESAHRIDADVVIPGRDQPFSYGSVVIKHEKIMWVGYQCEIPEEYKYVPRTNVPVVMPGLWDCHVHFYGAQKMSIDGFYQTSQALAGARGAHDVHATLNAGFTSVRELGGYGVELSQAVEEGTLIGPHIYSAVSPISMTGGHGDAHNTPLDALNDAIRHGLPLHLCDGKEECIKAVRIQLRRGAKVIKVCASGGVTSTLDDPESQQFSDEELMAMVEEAERADRIVAAHCHGKKGIMAALQAGCRTIEHGSYLDSEANEAMLESNAMLIATRTIIEGGLKLPDLWSPESYRKLQKGAEQHKKAYKMAVAAGVKIALGTDLGLGGVDPAKASQILGHGKNGRELFYAVEAGMTPAQAIEAATANAPETLGPQAPMSGQLKAGYDADLIGISENPLKDIEILADPKNVTHVWRGGTLFKSP